MRRMRKRVFIQRIWDTHTSSLSMSTFLTPDARVGLFAGVRGGGTRADRANDESCSGEGEVKSELSSNTLMFVPCPIDSRRCQAWEADTSSLGGLRMVINSCWKDLLCAYSCVPAIASRRPPMRSSFSALGENLSDMVRKG